MIKADNNNVELNGSIDILLGEYIQITDAIAEVMSNTSKKPKEVCIKYFLEEYIEGKFRGIKE